MNVRLISHGTVLPCARASACFRPFDIYRDPLVSEASQVAPLLGTLVTRVKEVLEEWPENPILTQVGLPVGAEMCRSPCC